MKILPDGMSGREYDIMLWNCEVRGVECEYGICDECPNTKRFSGSEENDGKRE